jgi:uncharacterized membrane protein
MTRYELFLFLHVAAAIIWLGAGFLFAMLVWHAIKEGDRQREAGYHQEVGYMAPRLFIPASFATLVFGIVAAADGDWPFNLWLVIGLVGWLVSFLLGILYFKPEGERIGALVAEHGPGNVEADERVHRLNWVDRVQLTILLTVVADMVIKPTGDDGGVLVVGAGILAAAILVATAKIRGREAPGPAA